MVFTPAFRPSRPGRVSSTPGSLRFSPICILGAAPALPRPKHFGAGTGAGPSPPLSLATPLGSPGPHRESRRSSRAPGGPGMESRPDIPPTRRAVAAATPALPVTHGGWRLSCPPGASCKTKWSEVGEARGALYRLLLPCSWPWRLETHGGDRAPLSGATASPGETQGRKGPGRTPDDGFAAPTLSTARLPPWPPGGSDTLKVQFIARGQSTRLLRLLLSLSKLLTELETSLRKGTMYV